MISSQAKFIKPFMGLSGGAFVSTGALDESVRSFSDMVLFRISWNEGIYAVYPEDMFQFAGFVCAVLSGILMAMKIIHERKKADRGPITAPPAPKNTH